MKIEMIQSLDEIEVVKFFLASIFFKQPQTWLNAPESKSKIRSQNQVLRMTFPCGHA